MKCTQCNNTSFIEDISSPYEVCDDGREHVSFKIYVCNQFGHVELFCLNPIKRKEELNLIEQKYKNDTVVLKKIINKYEKTKKGTARKLEKFRAGEINQLTEIMKDKYNTVIVCGEAKEELRKFKSLGKKQLLELIGLRLEDYYPDDKEYRRAKDEISVIIKDYEKAVSKIKSKYPC